MEALNPLTPEGAPAPTLLDLWRGVTRTRDALAPFLVGTVRGLTEAVLLAAVGAAYVYAESQDWVAFGIPIAAVIGGPTGLLVLNMIRGAIDQVDPRKARAIRAR